MFVAIIAPTASCVLYAGDSGGGNGSGSGCTESSITMRDPDTGTCQAYYSEYGDCGLVPGTSAGLASPPTMQLLPNWPACYTQCDNLDATTCEATSGCHAYFLDSDPAAFITCGSVGTSPPPTTPPIGSATDCVALDAFSCANADGCVSLLGPTDVDAGNPYWFVSCAVEPSTTICYSNNDCGVGYQCDHYATECPQTPDCPAGATGCGCPGVCELIPYVPCADVTTEAACDSRIDCLPVYDGDGCTCDPNQVCNCPVLTYSGCQDNLLDARAETVVTPHGNVGHLAHSSSK